MSAEIKQLQAIKVENFKVLTVGEDSYLVLTPPDPAVDSSGAVLLADDGLNSGIMQWLKAWNVDELVQIEHVGMRCVSRKLTVQEKEWFEHLRKKMIRCKKYGQNYFENSLMDEII